MFDVLVRMLGTNRARKYCPRNSSRPARRRNDLMKEHRPLGDRARPCPFARPTASGPRCIFRGAVSEGQPSHRQELAPVARWAQAENRSGSKPKAPLASQVTGRTWRISTCGRPKEAWRRACAKPSAFDFALEATSAPGGRDPLEACSADIDHEFHQESTGR